ncbi:MAG: DUF2461 domain-containing protein [Bacteroidota bacterium]|nr:DUF2461 domain-containing protein [Bacteroidota bacterium]MDP4225386.1 DUF2461 domain-containing protein [Bacteroidota bacterium]MDP4273787.1 DUF2461 domain-containing protein [Bacteroidota bacterium]
MNLKVCLDFLHGLKQNNNREWFNENKNFYLQAKKEYEVAVNLLISQISKFDKRINSSLSAGDCIFRIYRDIRFSNDKTPYKPNFGAYISKGGRKSQLAGYYFHMEADSCLLSCGCWMPQPPQLKAIRNDIYENIEEFNSILHDSSFGKYFNGIDGRKLQTAPKGYPKDFEHIDLLKYKDYCITNSITEDFVLQKDFIEKASEIFKVMFPFINFINEALE